ncbi:MAG: NAD(P) transhydrogenase subunit alpha [Candidatus Nanopelagicales bacterium]
MKLLIPAESRPGEKRVALVPESAGKLSKLGFTVAVQSGAGAGSLAADEDYLAAGVQVIPAEHMAAALGVADVVATVRPLHRRAVELLHTGAVTLSFLQPTADSATIAAAAKAGATALSFDLLPRISRAQSMDALTSQALCTGYRAAVVSAAHFQRFFPLFMTAAGTIPPAKVIVLGAGVAGLQAIATAKRLGAVVSAYDVRPASADEVRSMGATFIKLGLETAAGTGGYAAAQSAERAVRQMELLAPHVAGADILITTAAIPGRAAPRLVSAEMVAAMAPGSVVYDLAAESGGNVEGSQPGKIVRIGAADVIGAADAASELSTHASKLYSANVVALLSSLVNDGGLILDFTDEVTSGCALTHAGEVIHNAARAALGLSAQVPGEPAAAPSPPALPAEEMPADATVPDSALGTADSAPSLAAPRPGDVTPGQVI